MIVGFTLDVGNQDRLTAGFKNLETGKFYPNVLHNVGSIEFGSDKVVYYTECDIHNRPCVVKKLDLETDKTRVLFVDDDPTHYLDIGVTKD